MAGADSDKSIFYALCANSAIAKGIGAWLTGPGATLPAKPTTVLASFDALTHLIRDNREL